MGANWNELRGYLTRCELTKALQHEIGRDCQVDFSNGDPEVVCDGRQRREVAGGI